MNFDLSKTELFPFLCRKNILTAELPGVQFREHYIPNNLEQRYVGVFFNKTLRATFHIEKRAAKAGSTLYKLASLLKKLNPGMPSRLIKATVISALTFRLEIYTRNHINNPEVVSINICMKAVPKIVTGGWQKAELRVIYAEAGLHAPYPLIKKYAISGAARLLDRAPTHHLHSLLPWNRPKVYNLKAGTRNYTPLWTANQEHALHLQINRILNNILSLIENTTQSTRLAKLAI